MLSNCGKNNRHISTVPADLISIISDWYDTASEYGHLLRNHLTIQKESIRTLTKVAGENHHGALPIAMTIHQHINVVDNQKKLAYLFLIDSIVKGPGGVYQYYFQRHGYSIFVESYDTANDESRFHMRRVLNTWRPYFGDDLVDAISPRLEHSDSAQKANIRSNPFRSVQVDARPQRGTNMQAVDVGTANYSKLAQNKDSIGRGSDREEPISGSDVMNAQLGHIYAMMDIIRGKNHRNERQTSHRLQKLHRVITTHLSNLSRPSQIYTELCRLRAELTEIYQRGSVPPTVGNDVLQHYSLQRNPAKPHFIINQSNPRQSGTATVNEPGMVSRSKLVKNTHQNRACPMNPITDSKTRSVQFTALQEVNHRKAVDSLYSGLRYRCKGDGMRFDNSEALQHHLDWLFVVNRRKLALKRMERTVYCRPWDQPLLIFLSEGFASHNFQGQDIEKSITSNTSLERNSIGLEQVPAGKHSPKASCRILSSNADGECCMVCTDEVKAILDDESGKWFMENVKEVGAGQVAHIKCLADMTVEENTKEPEVPEKTYVKAYNLRSRGPPKSAPGKEAEKAVKNIGIYPKEKLEVNSESSAPSLPRVTRKRRNLEGTAKAAKSTSPKTAHSLSKRPKL